MVESEDATTVQVHIIVLQVLSFQASEQQWRRCWCISHLKFLRLRENVAATRDLWAGIDAVEFPVAEPGRTQQRPGSGYFHSGIYKY